MGTHLFGSPCNYIAIFGNVGWWLILIAMLVCFWDATQLLHREQVW